MSYARFAKGHSNVYVYLDYRGFLCCCGCRLGEDWYFEDTDAMVAHLRQHEKAGHLVPDYTIPALEEEREENDAWIAGLGVLEVREAEARDQQERQAM